MASAQLIGFAEAVVNIDRIPAVFQRRVRQALLDGAEIVRARAQALCPVDQGDLKAAIGVEVRGPNTVVVGLEQVQHAGRGGASSHQWPSVYGVWVEFGHYAGETFVAAQPFMRPAAEVGRVALPRIVEQAVTDAASEVAA